jgi:leader peptidase (prepilin peptidase)/N-methyltransferase
LLAFVHALLDGGLLLVLGSPFIGSFLGVVAERWPKGEAFVFGRSRCLHCKHVLNYRDLIPVISWLASRARCRYCGQPLPIRYPAVEVAALVVAIWSVVELPAELAWISSIFGWTLLTLAIIDLRWFWLPHALTGPLAAVGLLVTGLWRSDIPFDQLIGTIGGFLAMTGVAWLYRRYRGREGLGKGDAGLFGALGAWVGWQGLPTVLLYAGISGLLFLAMQRRTGQAVKLTTPLAFGPHLCLGGWLVWLYGPLYLEW